MYFGASQGRIPPVLKFSSTGEKQIIDPEKVMCLDLGFKTAILRRIWFDAAGFYQIYSNFQASEWISSPITGRFSQLVIDNNKAVSFGAESNLKAALLKGVDLFGNFAYIHARFNKVDSSDTRFQFSGNFLRLAPEFSFSAGLSLKIRLKKVLDLFVIPAYSWKSHFWSDNANTRGIDQEAYGILNGAAGFELKSLGLSLSAFAQNILDKRYIISGGNTGSMFGIPTFVPGSPRMIGTKLTWKWLK
jgi:outer membrane receptor protein involved in Fe transport